MDDLDVYESIGKVCIDCHLPYDLCNCPLDYVDEDEFCPTQRAAGQTPTEPPCDIAGSCYFGQDGKCLRGGVCR